MADNLERIPDGDAKPDPRALQLEMGAIRTEMERLANAYGFSGGFSELCYKDPRWKGFKEFWQAEELRKLQAMSALRGIVGNPEKQEEWIRLSAQAEVLHQLWARPEEIGSPHGADEIKNAGTFWGKRLDYLRGIWKAMFPGDITYD